MASEPMSVGSSSVGVPPPLPNPDEPKHAGHTRFELELEVCPAPHPLKLFNHLRLANHPSTDTSLSSLWEIPSM